MPTTSLAVRPAAADADIVRMRGRQPKLLLLQGGGGQAWDSLRGGNRGASRGSGGPHRGPLRGSKRGRWGGW
jgi:hypothetical protein